MEGTVICASRAVALVARGKTSSDGVADNAGAEDTGVVGLAGADGVSFCVLPAFVAGTGRASGLDTVFFAGTGGLRAGVLEAAGVLEEVVILALGVVLAGVLAAVLGATGLLAAALTTEEALDWAAGALPGLAVAAGFRAADLDAGLAADFIGAGFLGVVLFFAPAAAFADTVAPALPRAGLGGGLALEGDDVIDLAGLAFT